MIIADNETDVDYLYYEPVAKTVVKLIREKSKEALTVGLHGDWGAGKSSSLMMIEKAFSGDADTLCVRFNGWLFEGYDDAKAVLIETIVAQLLEKRSGLDKVKEKAEEVIKSVNWFKVARTLGGAALTFVTGLPNADVIRGLGKVASGIIADPTQVITGEMLNKVLDGAAEHFRADAPEDTAPQRMHEFRQRFSELLEIARIDRLVVLVDDLDRCLPKTAIATLEAIRLFLFIPKASFVIAADEGMIEYAVRQHFPDLPASAGPTSYARNYLEKLIQVPFRMPALGYLETRVYLTLLLYLNSGADPSSADFGKLLNVAREALKRPWQTQAFTRDEIKREVAIPEKLDEALQVAGEITRILADGARGNPRQIKRFVNTMSLRLAIAEERGFGTDLRPPILAKLMLVERFAPDTFEAIARDSVNDGKSKILAELEAAETEAVGERDTAEAAWAKRWAKTEPKLATTDLRPYVFISRDRRATLGTPPLASQVEMLIEKLSSSTFQIAAVESSVLNGLQAPDAYRVFEGLVTKVNANEQLEKRPAAADGLVRLVKHRPELQEPLGRFLERIPIKSAQPWIVNGWNEAFDDQHLRQFEGLIDQWMEQTENKALSGIAKLQKRSRSNLNKGK
jgi:predicted KAP-like P-loop ATPase